jgi:hypothetical protein
LRSVCNSVATPPLSVLSAETEAINGDSDPTSVFVGQLWGDFPACNAQWIAANVKECKFLSY